MKSEITNLPASARRHARRGTLPALQTLADQIRQARTATGLTQDQLSLVSGVSRDTVIALENARPGVSLGNLVSVLGVLGLAIRLQGTR
ncbi:helix-turn-helix domain-containing protein [Tahibacter amnicola]|uniref:Helix-turn-helix domain-containing protein n=1 Tax=Tahibacter amnicola TaxID=2976241 RepID=A0ABY6BK88_9GAMM|nr:helix-turn-helix domain-containing protein [Tahibacter amnicola]UXI68800.1 helix-turn-helix domain-containing protein [Tahibacter amnicola]